MESDVLSYNHTTAKLCDVCSAQLNFIESMHTADLGYTVCGRFDCRKIMASHKHLSPSMLQFSIRSSNQIHKSWQQKQQINKQRIESINTKEKLEKNYFYQRYLDTLNSDDTSHVKCITIPSGNPEEEALSIERIDEYTNHLDKIIDSALSNEAREISSQDADARLKLIKTESRLSDKPELSQLSDRFCSLCRGGCCAAGKDHAYLSSTTIMNSMQYEKLNSREQIKERYLALLPEYNITNSCINHTQTGCALPRELRSDICNGYYCNPLEKFQMNYSHEDDLKILTIQRSSNYWNRYDSEVENEVTGVYEVTENSICKINLDDV